MSDPMSPSAPPVAAQAEFDIARVAEKIVDVATVEVVIDGEVLMGTAPDGSRAPASITYHAPGSKEFRKAKTESKNKVTKRIIGKGGRFTEAKEGEEEYDIALFLSKITISFNNFGYRRASYNGDDKRMFLDCFADPKMEWLTSWFNAQAGDWGNAGLKSSPA